MADGLETRVAVIERRLDDIDEKLDDGFDGIRKDVKDIHDIVTRYKGFAGGVLFVLSIIAAVMATAWKELVQAFRGP